MIYPDFSYELKYKNKIVAGCDEVGKGCIAGPVVASAVIFQDININIPVLITDSKKMTKKEREKAYKWIINNAIVGIGIIDNKEIDKINILNASLVAMKKAIYNLKVKPDVNLIDGKFSPQDCGFCETIIKGDLKSLSIASASIIAKETRDNMMIDLSKQYPIYLWDKNVGYPTKYHINKIKEFGITKYHRRTFKPIKEYLISSKD